MSVVDDNGGDKQELQHLQQEWQGHITWPLPLFFILIFLVIFNYVFRVF